MKEKNNVDEWEFHIIKDGGFVFHICHRLQESQIN